MDLEAKFNQIKNMPQYRDKSEAEIKKIAKELLKEEDKKYKVEWVGLTTAEKKKADKLFDEYSKKYQITKLSDLEDLKSLIFTTTVKERIQKILQKLEKSGNAPPVRTMDSYDTLHKQESELKARLGLGQEKKESKWKVFWTNFKKKLLHYVLYHKGAFYFKCPSCKKMALLLRKVEDYNTFDFTMFRGTYLYNEEMFKDIDSGKISKEDVSRYWGLQNTDYINLIYEKVWLPEQKKKKENK